LWTAADTSVPAHKQNKTTMPTSATAMLTAIPPPRTRQPHVSWPAFLLRPSLQALLLLALLQVLPSQAAEERTEAGLLAGGDWLSEGRAGWRNESVFIDRKWADGAVGGVRVNTTQRFGLNDSQVEGYYSLPLTQLLRIGVDAQVSPTHKVLAKHGLGASAQYEFAKAWLAHTSVRQLRYDSVTVDQLSAGVEHYFGNWGAYAGIVNSHAYGADTQTYIGRLSRYYGERDRVNLIIASGREPVNIAGVVTTSDVNSATVTGRHWLSKTVAIDYSAGITRQGDFYTRRGGSLGLTIAF